MKERGFFENLGIDGSFAKERDVRLWPGLIWLTIGFSSGLL
jgi:hypothetical protein